MDQINEESQATQEPVAYTTNHTTPPYRIPLGASGEFVELHPKALGVGQLSFKGEPLHGTGSLLSRRYAVQGSDGQTYEIECKPHILGGLPLVRVNGTRHKVGPALVWMYPLAALAIAPVALGSLSCLGWLALVQVGPTRWWAAVIALVGPILGGLLVWIGAPRVIRTLRPALRIVAGIVLVLLVLVLLLIAGGLLLFGALFSNM